MAMETKKKIWLAKGKFMNELHPLEVIDIKNNLLDEGCQFLHVGRGEKRNWAGTCPVPPFGGGMPAYR